MAAVQFGFGAPVFAFPRNVALYPSTVNRYTAGCGSTTSNTEEKPFSCHRNAGKLFLKIDASYARALKVSELVRDTVAVAPYSFVAKVFPEANCDWPQKAEVTLEVSLSTQPEPVGPYGARVEQLVQNSRVFGSYLLKLSARKLPPDFRVDLRNCKVQSLDQKTFPIYCESSTNSPPNSCEALLRLQSTSQITVSFELRLTSVIPVHNAFDAAVSLSARLLRSAKSTGDILLKTQGGLEVPAHMAVLSDVPFFKTHFGPEWKEQPVVGEPATCMLPVEADEETLRLFLSYVYGEPHSLDAIKSHLILQSLFSLGEACDLAVLCKDVANVTKVRANEISDWVDWLNKEHLSEVQSIKDQVAALVKESVLAKPKFWEDLSMEELRHIHNAAKRQKCIE